MDYDKLRRKEQQGIAAENFLSSTTAVISNTRKDVTRADKGEVTLPKLVPAMEPRVHAYNAFMEFLSITKASKQVSKHICENIMRAYKYNNDKLLDVRLREADAAIYDNANSQIIRGKMGETYMAAYSVTSGFVVLDEAKTKKNSKLCFDTPPNDPVVVVAKCTEIMLHDKILEMAKTITGNNDVKAILGAWTLPSYQWINGVPGCGKTTWIINNFNGVTDVAATTTVEAAKDLKERLAQRMGDHAKGRVRTMASILANGFKESSKCSRLIVDEALMNHFGAITMAAQLSGASDVSLIGDINQLPFIDRDNLFKMLYTRPNLVTNITQELLCTHRNPLDVAYALKEVYNGIYSSNVHVKSMGLMRFSGAHIPSTLQNTLFLTHTQEEKATLHSQGYGKGKGSRILTIHESQGLTYKSVVIIQTKSTLLSIHESVSHAVVAVSRHTESCIYHTDNSDDAIGRFVKRAEEASPTTILDYNLQMAIHHRDQKIINQLKEVNLP